MDNNNNESKTFEELGKIWNAHTPGDPCPVPPDAKIFILFRDGEAIKPSFAAHYIWNTLPLSQCVEIIGWRYAEEQPKQEAKADFGEPWSYDDEDGLELPSGMAIVWGEDHEYFHRAVSCVNACAGMADPAKEIAELRQENQQMREAIKEAHGAIKFFNSNHPDGKCAPIRCALKTLAPFVKEEGK